MIIFSRSDNQKEILKIVSNQDLVNVRWNRDKIFVDAIPPRLSFVKLFDNMNVFLFLFNKI